MRIISSQGIRKWMLQNKVDQNLHSRIDCVVIIDNIRSFAQLFLCYHAIGIYITNYDIDLVTNNKNQGPYTLVELKFADIIDIVSEHVTIDQIPPISKQITEIHLMSIESELLYIILLYCIQYT